MTVPSILSVTGSPITSSGTFAITTAVAPTGAGAIVLANSPTLVTPILGAATATSIQASTPSRLVISSNDTIGTTNGIELDGFYSSLKLNTSDLPLGGFELSGSSGVLSTESLTIYGTVTLTSVALNPGNLVVQGTTTLESTVTLSSLTASTALALDASKNLVSVSNTGTGNNVLANSPTLVTPNIGAADASAINSTILNSFVISSSDTSLATSYGISLSAFGASLSLNTSLIPKGFILQADDPTDFCSFQGAITLYGELSITNSVGGTGNLTVSGTTTLSTLTASSAVATNASKQLVSIANTGTGNNVLATSPTLVTPIIGAATGTSLSVTDNVSGGTITATSGAVGMATFGPSASTTTATSIYVRNATTQNVEICIAGGTGNFSTSAVIGDTVIRATGRILVQSGGGVAGLVVNTNNSVWVAGTLGIGVTSPNAQLHLANSLANRKIVLFANLNNEHNFYGFGINANTLRYQVDSTGANHVFYAATSSTTSNELARISGNGNFSVPGTSTLGGNTGIKVFTSTGTLPAAAGSTTVSYPAGVTLSNIISVTGVATSATSQKLPAFSSIFSNSVWWIEPNASDFVVGVETGASEVASRPYIVTFITNS